MQVTQKDKHQGRSGGNMSTGGGFAMNNHKNGGNNVSMKRWPKRASPVLIAATAAAIMYFSAATFAAAQEQGGLLRQGNGPGPAANEVGPGCNIVPPLASIGTKVKISQFPPPDSLTDPELAGAVQTLQFSHVAIPLQNMTPIHSTPRSPRATNT